uniref:Integrase, catalytic region, zinc finger, CCHC-type, peptidase aspartic, catalytic n=1 Tax=Tanacetum cinerariifolium TaxID=118510 RepID=A0A699GIR5_TANCI|nr:hypothetical protein [Tanacetum cinerariifolium]
MNAVWYKDKAMIAEAQEAGQILNKEQPAFLVDLRVPDGQAVQSIIPNNVAFQAEDLDTYDSDCDDISNAKAVLMANISNYGSDVITDVPHSETYHNDMKNQSVHAMQDFEQTPVVDVTNNEITSYQNSFYLKKAQQIKATLYDGIVISNKHVVMPVIDNEETLILEEDFGKCFVPQQELSADEAFWYHMLNPSTKSSDALPVKIEAPKELPKVILVNENLKKLKLHLANFDKVVKIRTTPNARTKVQTTFDQMKAAVQQCSVDKHCFKIAKKELLLENDRLLQQIMSQDVLLIVMKSMSLNEYFENIDLKAQLQDKDTTICKLKEIIKSMRKKSKKENVNYDYWKIEIKNMELENSVAELLLENERLCKEINHVKHNLKSAENEDLKAQIQDKIFVITSLKNDLRKVKGKEIVYIAAQKPFANTIVPGMFKLDLDPLAPKLLQNREAHIDYLKYTQEQADTLRGIVKQAKAKQPLDNALDFACKHA